MKRSAICALVVVSVFGCSRTVPTPQPRNLLIVSVDTLRADAIGIAGGRAKTPNIDALLERGTYFRQAIAPIPRTTPSLASLFTGLWPARHGSREVGEPIRDEVATLAELLHAQGLATLATSTNGSAGPKQRFDRGFDRYVTYEQLMAKHGDQLYRDLTNVPADRGGWASATTGAALELFEGLGDQQPFFLWVFFFDPHFLYRPPSPWQDEVAAERCWALYEAFQDRREAAGQVFTDVEGVSSDALEDCKRLYEAEIAYADHEIGRLLDTLEKSGRLDDTLIVFVADHGENLGEGGLFFEHGDNTHDAGIRVPLAFIGPGVASGVRDDGPVSLVDIVPTVLSMLELDEPSSQDWDGIDLSKRLRPEAAPRRRDLERIVFAESASALWNEATDAVITGRNWWRICINGPRYSLCEIPRSQPGEYLLYDHVVDPKLETDIADQHSDEVSALAALWDRWPPESARQRVARTARFKLVESPRLEGGYDRRLVDLENDPAETGDVRDQHPEVLARLGAALDAWTATLPAVNAPSLDPELEETLRSLGYIR